MKKDLTRRQFARVSFGFAGLALAGCTTTNSDGETVGLLTGETSSFRLNYGPVPEERFPLPAIDSKVLKPQFRRRRVNYETSERPGTVVVDTSAFYLYHVEPGGTAMRYGVGLGRQGFEWSGRARIAWKRPWPTWTPPDEMIARRPELEKWSVRNGGMPPGLQNPLGARALYIFQGGKDTLYRLHGTNEPHSISKAVSSGCVRLVNQDVIDLFNRVKSGSRILVT